MASLLYPCGESRQHGQTREISPGVLWIRMPMPFALNHINLWPIRDRDSDKSLAGWPIVDTGLQTPFSETCPAQIRSRHARRVLESAGVELAHR